MFQIDTAVSFLIYVVSFILIAVFILRVFGIIKDNES